MSHHRRWSFPSGSFSILWLEIEIVATGGRLWRVLVTNISQGFCVIRLELPPAEEVVGVPASSEDQHLVTLREGLSLGTLLT